MPRATIDFYCYRAFNIKDEAGNTIIEMVATFVLIGSGYTQGSSCYE